ncbi:MAG: hypothetical protein NWF07_04465 [Candidatus Bathyarchaeota archaeon]|nr:hypothetical protein [Candidatus Bathyarchaeota archaeon]
MADLLNQANLRGSYYSSGPSDTSTGYWTYAFGNSIWFRGATETRSNSYESHPKLACEFWRYSISQQAWVQVHSINIGSSNTCVYRVRCNKSPHSGTVRAEYYGDDSYLFAFKAYTYEGERSRCNDAVYVYEIGDDTQYQTTVQGRRLYMRNEDKALVRHTGTSPGSYSLTQNWLKTDAMRGTLITLSLSKRLISAKSAIAFS